MHFALPPRKTSHPPPYALPARSNPTRGRNPLHYIGGIAVFLIIVFLLRGGFSGGGSQVDSKQGVVIVTMFDRSTMSEGYIKKIKQNREDYALRHGYGTFYTDASDYKYKYENHPASWGMIPSMRHAFKNHTDIEYIWQLSAHSLILNPELSLHEQILKDERISSIMLRDLPVVPPDSVIHTFSHLSPDRVSMIISQDHEGLSATSIILRNDDWSQFCLDVWFDPLMISYNFQKAEVHALEHIIQWHPTILAQVAVIPQKAFNSYAVDVPNAKGQGLYADGDFVVTLNECGAHGESRNCEKEMDPYFRLWVKTIEIRKKQVV
ncbi:MAG: hypothetical protein M1834_002950 [Cirrosporium novae-zelandiae]|nr:MAG: hypothetical protein M1834_002950 [Cirrosporium novae-zelandiae]